MNGILESRDLKVEFEKYLETLFLKNLTLILTLGVFILSFYIYSDWSVRQSFKGVTTRIFPLVLIVVLLVTHFLYRNKYYRFKYFLYIAIYLALQLMMYAKCLIHLNDDGLAPSVTGTILVIFLISLDIKQNDRLTAFIYAFPIIVFTSILIFIHQPSSKEFIVLADIYPIVVVGFIINRMQYRLRFRLFKSNKLLYSEQEKTKALYSESLRANDMLEKKAMESGLIKEEIQEKNRELKKINATKDKFLGIIAHDLKNPISTVWGLSDLLLSDNSLDGKKKEEFIEVINETIKHTHSLLENLLDWARAQSNSIAYAPSLHNANEIVEKELRVLRTMAEKKGISVQNSITSDLKVYADLYMFRTIIRNLLSNAIKYTHLNGEIEITAQLIQNNNNNESVEVSVIDNGIGMNACKLGGLFKIAHNISTLGTENEAGTGLGLLLCKEFMDIHMGSIVAISKPNEGSAFRCVFPLK
jgi:signal transduction histidine kinase